MEWITKNCSENTTFLRYFEFSQVFLYTEMVTRKKMFSISLLWVFLLSQQVNTIVLCIIPLGQLVMVAIVCFSLYQVKSVSFKIRSLLLYNCFLYVAVISATKERCQVEKGKRRQRKREKHESNFAKLVFIHFVSQNANWHLCTDPLSIFIYRKKFSTSSVPNEGKLPPLTSILIWTTQLQMLKVNQIVQYVDE